MSMFTIFISSLVASNFDSYISNLWTLCKIFWLVPDYQYILLTCIPEGITGSIYSAVISVNTYTTTVTPTRLMSLRMAIIQVTTSIGKNYKQDNVTR
jgi:hypothetical protein